MNLRARDRLVGFPRRPLVMGILNLESDSFSGDRVENAEFALRRARQMAAEGADIIDVGAETASTASAPVSEAEEIARLLPFVRRFTAEKAGFPAPGEPDALFPPLLSINTWRPAVARAVLAEGGEILNDIGALPTGENAELCAATGAALVVMHNEGTPKVFHPYHAYDDVMAALEAFFEEKIALAEAAGLPREALILDPGIGFTKLRDDNLRILRGLERLHRFGRPVLLPVSRKPVIGEVLGGLPASERDAGTAACIVAGLKRGAQIFRVHNVRAAVQTLDSVLPVLRAAATSASV